MPDSVSDIQRRLEKLDPSGEGCRQLLHQLLTHKDLKQHIQALKEPGLRGFIELLDKALDHIPVTDDLFRKTLRRLQSICSNRAMLPLSHLIPSESISNKGEAIASGGFSNVHQAEFDGKKVCIKVLRLYAQDTSDFTKKTFYREVVVWKRLQHPNIVPFLGVPAREPPPLEIICDWMENSRVTEYVRANPKVDCTNLLWDVVDGLHYLHSCNVIHGNLKGANILIDKDGHARLADFGLTSIIRGEDSTRSPQDSNTNNTTTWAAPEILKEGSVSKEGDVFTFAMVTVEIFTGHAPFVKNYQSAIFDIISGKRPQRPHKLHHDGLWQLVQRCWNEQPGERPTSSQLLEFFQTSFPRERRTSKVRTLPSTSSTWTLVGAGGHTDGNTKPRPYPFKQDTQDGDKPGPQDPYAGDPQMARTEPPAPMTRQVSIPGERAPPTPVHNPVAPKESPPPQTEDKSSQSRQSTGGQKGFMKKLFCCF